MAIMVTYIILTLFYANLCDLGNLLKRACEKTSHTYSVVVPLVNTDTGLGEGLRANKCHCSGHFLIVSIQQIQKTVRVF